MAIETLHFIRILKDEPVTIEWMGADGAAALQIVLTQADAELFRELKANGDWEATRSHLAEQLVKTERKLAREKNASEMARVGWKYKNGILAEQVRILKEGLDNVAAENLQLKAQLNDVLAGEIRMVQELLRETDRARDALGFVKEDTSGE